jgi:hypothetical protein
LAGLSTFYSTCASVPSITQKASPPARPYTRLYKLVSLL